jgi:hypothetical protein
MALLLLARRAVEGKRGGGGVKECVEKFVNPPHFSQI